MNGDSSGKFCNYCDSTDHFYTECMLWKFDELVHNISINMVHNPKTIDKTEDTPGVYPGDSVYDHMWQINNKGRWPEADVNWGGFWSTEDRSGYTDMQGPDDYYAGEGAGDS